MGTAGANTKKLIVYTMHRLFLITCIVLFMDLYNSYCQTSTEWNLNMCIDYALENNLEIKQHKLETLYKKNLLEQSKADYLPDLKIGVEQNLFFSKTLTIDNELVANNYQSKNIYASASVILFDGFQTGNLIHKNKLDYLSNIEKLNNFKETITIKVTLAYMNILYAKELTKIYKEQAQITEKQIEKTNHLIKAGVISEGNIYEMQAQLLLEKKELIDAQNQLKEASLTLKQLLEFKESSQLTIIVPDIEIDTTEFIPDIDAIFESAQKRPIIKEASLNQEKFLQELIIAKKGKYPILRLESIASTKYSSNLERPTQTKSEYVLTEQLNNNFQQAIYLSLTIPVFSKRQVKVDISNARINYNYAQYSLDLTRNNVYEEIQQIHSDLLSAKAKYKVTSQAYIAVSEAYRYAQQKFDVGIVNSFDLNSSKIKLSQTSSELAQSKYEYYLKHLLLGYYITKEIQVP